jgi:deazaflavin-dependent oxidoreductase (nitroreductase family)
MNDWNKQIIAEFRANGGKVAQFGDAPMVILHTIGAKSGELREIPLVAKLGQGDMIVFASKAGATTNPDWYHNLAATPEIDVEFGAEKFRARLDQLSAEDASSAIRAQAELMPAFGDYVKSAAPRQIPAFAIRRL